MLHYTGSSFPGNRMKEDKIWIIEVSRVTECTTSMCLCHRSDCGRSFINRVTVHPEQTSTGPVFVVWSQLLDQKSQCRVQWGHEVAWCTRQVGGQTLLLVGRSKVDGLSKCYSTVVCLPYSYPAAVVPACPTALCTMLLPVPAGLCSVTFD